jgi:hypothetical protein
MISLAWSRRGAGTPATRWPPELERGPEVHANARHHRPERMPHPRCKPTPTEMDNESSTHRAMCHQRLGM